MCKHVFIPQLHAAISQSEEVDSLGLGPGCPLVSSLKQRVVSLASNSGVISTVQMAAQATLQSGWSILLPTAEERARALSTLLANGGNGLCRLATVGRHMYSTAAGVGLSSVLGFLTAILIQE